MDAPALSSPFARFRAGDRAAAAEVAREYAEAAHAVAIAILGDPRSAEDAAAAGLGRALRRTADFDPARDDESAWLLLAVREECLSRLRGGSPAAERPLPSGAGARAALEALAGPDRELLVLAGRHAMPPEEIARRTGRTAAEVRGHLRRALLELHDAASLAPVEAAL